MMNNEMPWSPQDRHKYCNLTIELFNKLNLVISCVVKAFSIAETGGM